MESEEHPLNSSKDVVYSFLEPKTRKGPHRFASQSEAVGGQTTGNRGASLATPRNNGVARDLAINRWRGKAMGLKLKS